VWLKIKIPSLVVGSSEEVAVGLAFLGGFYLLVVILIVSLVVFLKFLHKRAPPTRKKTRKDSGDEELKPRVGVV